MKLMSKRTNVKQRQLLAKETLSPQQIKFGTTTANVILGIC